MSIPHERSVAGVAPDIIKFWDLSNTLGPAEVYAKSGKKFYWKCEAGHVSLSAPYGVINTYLNKGKIPCGICYGRIPNVGTTDLNTTHPTLSTEWSPKNTMSPTTVSAGSNKKVWWVCEKGHEWEAVISSRARGLGCPFCSGRNRIAGFNDLASTHPKLMLEWSPNNTLNPTSISAFSHKKALWVCKMGHEWVASIKTRISTSSGCPYCAGQRAISGINDLATTHPSLCLEWSFEKNKDKPQKYMAGSNKKVWWVCSQGHEWEAQISNRTHGRNCPICSNKQIVVGINDLFTIKPELKKSWSIKNNIDPYTVSYGSEKKAIWECEHGHTWSANVASRSAGTGCPKCANRFSKMEQDVADTIRLLGVDVVSPDRATIKPLELDIYIPSYNFAIEFNGLYWHSEAAGKDKDYHANKTRLCAEKGIRLLHIWEDEWLRNPELVKRMIARKLGKSAEIRVPARKTTVVSITKDEALPFLNEHHIQGFTSGTYYLGLRHEDELVAVMVLKKTKQELRLERYATSCIVQGGFGKMIAWIQRTLDFEKIITFADLCVSDGGLYENNGWTRDGELAPDYRYVVRSERVHKFNYRLKRFREDPDLLWEEGLTEKQLAELNGIPRIWDCGKIRYILHKEKNDKTT